MSSAARRRYWLLVAIICAAAVAAIVMSALQGSAAAESLAPAANASTAPHQAVLAYQAPDTPAPSVAGATTPFTTHQAPEGALAGGAKVISLGAARRTPPAATG